MMMMMMIFLWCTEERKYHSESHSDINLLLTETFLLYDILKREILQKNVLTRVSHTC